MATIFLSYQHDDEDLARGLELRLENKQHNIKIKVGEKPAGDLRKEIAKALEASDAAVFLRNPLQNAPWLATGRNACLAEGVHKGDRKVPLIRIGPCSTV